MAWLHRGNSNGGGGSPVLGGQSALADGRDYTLLSVTTNIGSGTLYYDVSTSCGLSPTAAQVKAGTVTGSVINGNQTVSISGAQSANPNGLTKNTTYCAYFVHNAGSDSNVVASSSFKTGGQITFSNTLTAAWNANPNVAAFNTVLTNVEQELTDCFTSNGDMTINYTFDFNVCALACTAISFITFGTTYTDQRNNLLALPNQSSVQRTAYATLPGSDPTSSAQVATPTCLWDELTAQSCTVSFPTTVISNAQPIDTTADGKSNPSGGYSLYLLLRHEITEGAFGRVSGYINFTSEASPLDYFTYSALNTRNFQQNASTRYPSIDSGQTNLISTNTLNQNPAGDGSDEGTSFTGPQGQVSAFTAFGSTGTYSEPTLTIDNTYVNLMGWGLTHSCRLSAGL